MSAPGQRSASKTRANRLVGLYRRLPHRLRSAIPPKLKAALRKRMARSGGGAPAHPAVSPPMSPQPSVQTSTRPAATPGGRPRKGAYATGDYWKRRTDMLYYQYFRYMMRCIAHDATRIADVGSGNCPYLEWFDWVPERVSIDLRTPYRSETVTGIEGDILALDLPRFDVVTCLQVIEHVPDPAPFTRRLLEMGRVVLVSVPYRWPPGTRGHVNDPVDLRKLEGWFGRRENYHIIVKEPFVERKGARLFAIFDAEDPERRFGREMADRCRPT